MIPDQQKSLVLVFLNKWRNDMKRSRILTVLLVGLCLLWGCASTEMTARRSNVGEERIARPSRIIVYNFAATPDDVPADSAIADLYARRATPQSDAEIELGRQLGRQVAAKLVQEILAMGMPAELADSGPPRQEGNIVLYGEFISIDEGSRAARMLVGFGAGAAELKTLVEGFQVTASGLRPLGSAEFRTAGGKLPGIVVPLGVGAATGRTRTTAVIAGGANIVQELGPESMRAAANRTAKDIAQILQDAFKKQGWI